jgi:aldose sugar dehydrogenase
LSHLSIQVPNLASIISIKTFKAIISLALFTLMLPLAAQNRVVVVEGITVPWGMVQLENGDLLVTERAGKLYRVTQKGDKQEISGLPEIKASGQGGLLDIIKHPNYQSNGWLYFSYSSSEGKGFGAHTAIMRAKLKDNQLTNNQLIYKGSPNVLGGHHFGSRLAFDKQGMLYFSIGDRGDRDELPQNLELDGGKIYRLQDDGQIPMDNPFVKGAKPAVYSYGHRNPQGMALNPATGDIWAHEHGPRGGDELNIIQAGKNYGWPVISYGVNYSGTKFTDLTHKAGMEQPVHYWVPSIAPSGMAFITSDKYPNWQGKLLIGSLKFNYLVLLTLDGDKILKAEIVEQGIGRVRNVKQLDDGYIYIALDGQGVVRLDRQ